MKSRSLPRCLRVSSRYFRWSSDSLGVAEVGFTGGAVAMFTGREPTPFPVFTRVDVFRPFIIPPRLAEATHSLRALVAGHFEMLSFSIGQASGHALVCSKLNLRNPPTATDAG